ncbi:hypothetical protein [Spirochaeta dissipatitropha]
MLAPTYRSRSPVLLLVLLLALLPLSVRAERLEGTFWYMLERESMPGAGETDPDMLILEEARYVFSGMIYGWQFRYIPQNTARGYEETFELTPVFQIPFGDKGLVVRQIWLDDGLQKIRIDYRMDEDQIRRHASWRSGRIQAVQGAGEASFYRGFDGRIESMEDALRMSVREHLRARHNTPPREVQGRIVLDSVPLIGVSGGSYTARLRARMQISSIREYDVF